MNVDRLMLVVVLTVVAVVWLLMFVGGIATGALLWWKLPLAATVYFGLQLTIVAAGRRFALNERGQHFLGTVPLAALFLIITIQGFNHLPPGGLVSAFLIVEAVFLVLAAISWRLRKRQTDPAL
jgi:hypothetical protein